MTQDSFWKGRCVFVTGHTGFVGCWLAQTLALLGADVTGFSLPAEAGALFFKVKDALPVHSVEGDLRDKAAVRDALSACAPEIVFHIAAFGFVNECFADPDRAFETNVGGTLNLLEAIRNCTSAKTLVVASSDKVYYNKDLENKRFVETDALGGIDPYSASKTCEDMLTQSFFESYLKERGISCAILRPSNILGGGDHLMTRLIPGMFYSLSRGETPEIRNPHAVRPWQNIMDAVDAYLHTAKYASAGELSVYNVGPQADDIWTVGEIASYVSELYGRRFDVFAGARKPKVHEYTNLGLDSGKIMRELGWYPIRKLKDTLLEIYDFYTADDGENTALLCKKQIERYYTERSGANGTLEQ